MTATTPLCACGCGRPSPDAYARTDCAAQLAAALRTAAGHAEDAEAVVARMVRYGGGSRGGHSEPLPVDLTASDRLRAVGTTMTTWARLLSEEGTTP